MASPQSKDNAGDRNWQLEAMSKEPFNYALYLVTDSTMLPPNTTLLSQVEAALRGGATLVQLREKTLETGEFIERAKQVHTLTRKYGVPLIINDRVDVALAVDCEGVHVGQDDMAASTVRRLLGKDKLVGVSVRDEAELQVVLEENVADYIGIGAVYGTKTKAVKKPPMGTEGVVKLLEIIERSGKPLKTVVIGGINDSNLDEVWGNCKTVGGKSIDGVAVVSCIMASPNAEVATSQIRSKLTPSISPGAFFHSISQRKPLVHHLTNNVVKNFSANVTLAVGASPIMSEASQEFGALANIPYSCVVVNSGTITDGMSHIYLSALNTYHLKGRPIVYDPVGCGASEFRREFNTSLLKNTYGNLVIKGNSAEICALAGINVKQRGVDSSETGLAEDKVLKAASDLSFQHNCVVCVTGKEDLVVADGGAQIARVVGGHELMGRVTGTGCALSSVIASFLAANPTPERENSSFEACISALTVYKNAGAAAAKKARGPGSFIGNFLDELYKMSAPN